MALTDVSATDQPTTMPPPQIAPPVSIASPPPTPFQQSEMGYQPPPVVDRVAYLDQLKQAWTQAEEQRVQQEALHQQQLQALMSTGPLGTMRRAFGTAEKLAAGPDVDVRRYGYDPQDPSTWADAIAKATAEAQRRAALMPNENPQVKFPGQEQDITQFTPLDVPQVAGQALMMPFNELVAPHLPANIGAVPVRAPVSAAANFVGGSLPAVGLGLLLGPLAATYFGVAGAKQLGDIARSYENGEISGEKALIDAATVAPNFVPLAIHAGGKLGELAQSERGQTILARIKSEFAAHPGELAPSERGGGTFGEKPPAPEPPKDIGDLVIQRVNESQPIRAAQTEARSVEEAARARELDRIRNDPRIPIAQKSILMAQALKGTRPAGDFSAITLTPEESAAAMQRALDSPNVSPHDAFRLIARENPDNPTSRPGIFEKLERGLGLQQNEENLLIKVFGPKMADALEARKTGANTLEANITNAMQPPRSVGPTEPAIAPLGANRFLEGPQGVQAGADVAVNQAMQAQQRTGRGLYGIAEPRALEANIGAAMQPPRSEGPIPPTTVVRPYSEASANAADIATTSAVNQAMLEHQTRHGAQPEWQYAEQQARAALTDPQPLKAMSNWAKVMSPFQLWRSWLTAFDNSFLGRQGWKLAASNTREFAETFKRSWQIMLSKPGAAQEVYDGIMQEVTSAPHYDLGQRLKRPLEIQTVGGGLNPAEEYLSPLTKRIPILGRSEQAFTASGNYIRQMSFERDVGTWERINKMPITDDIAQRLADNLNNATGRGNIRGMRTNAGFLGQTFFSIRNKAALGEFITDTVRAMRPGVDPTVRRIIATRFAGWLTLNMSLLYAAKWAGATTGAVDADLNPFSPTFGRIKGAGQTFDIWGGYQPIVRAVIQLGSGQAARPGYSGLQPVNRTNIAGDYVRGQFSPAAGVLFDMSFGHMKNYAGQDLTDPNVLKQYGLNQVEPLFFQDTWQAWKAGGIVGLLTGGAAAVSGIGVQSQSRSPLIPMDNALKSDPRFAGYEHYTDLPNDLKGQFDQSYPDLVKNLQESHAQFGKTTFDDLKKASQEGLADLGKQLQGGQLQPAEYRTAVSDFISSQSAKYEQALKDAGLTGRDLSGDPKLLNDFFTSLDSARNMTTGQTDFDKQAQLEQKFRAGLDENQNKRLDEMLSYSSDPQYAQLKQDKMTLAKSGYYDRQRTTFEDWLSGLQQSSAPADLKAQAQDWTSPSDLQAYARNLVTSHGGPPQYYNLQPIWKGWQKFYDGQNQRFLASNPEIDVLAVMWGYQDRVHSAEAARLYHEKTGLNPPVPRG